MPFVAGQKLRAQELNDIIAVEPDGDFDRAELINATTTSESFAPLFDPPLSVTVEVESSGIALVIMSCWRGLDTEANAIGLVDFSMTGANSRTASDLSGLQIQQTATPSNDRGTVCYAQVLTGLTQGTTTFTMEFCSLFPGDSVQFEEPAISVVTY